MLHETPVWPPLCRGVMHAHIHYACIWHRFRQGPSALFIDTRGDGRIHKTYSLIPTFLHVVLCHMESFSRKGILCYHDWRYATFAPKPLPTSAILLALPLPHGAPSSCGARLVGLWASGPNLHRIRSNLLCLCKAWFRTLWEVSVLPRPWGGKSGRRPMLQLYA